jgi:BirA family biotin operon repressor/biotin-[acetyl-CoA-carboxylase] ligase
MIETGEKHDRGELLASILNRFEEDYEIWEREGFGPVSFEMERRMLWLGEEIVLDAGTEEITGRLAGITADGYLRVETEAGERVYSSGDVTLRKDTD